MKHKIAMTGIELFNLRKLCRKYGVDPAEVDGSISYWENLEHLEKFVPLSMKMDRVTEMEEDIYRDWLHDHALTHYASCHKAGETASTMVGEPDKTPPRFSLKTMSNIGFSLLSLAKQKRENDM